MFTLNCCSNLLTIDSPIVMGIINATPDSFYKGNIKDDILGLAAQMLSNGATILDIGGQSTKPNSIAIDTAEELQRVIPSIEAVKKRFPDCIISIDTFNATVAAEAIQTILRREAYPDPYEALKGLTRTNAKINQKSIADFIDTLEVTEDIKNELKKTS